jgi:hypothetical protein
LYCAGCARFSLALASGGSLNMQGAITGCLVNLNN